MSTLFYRRLPACCGRRRIRDDAAERALPGISPRRDRGAQGRPEPSRTSVRRFFQPDFAPLPCRSAGGLGRAAALGRTRGGGAFLLLFEIGASRVRRCALPRGAQFSVEAVARPVGAASVAGKAVRVVVPALLRRTTAGDGRVSVRALPADGRLVRFRTLNNAGEDRPQPSVQSQRYRVVRCNLTSPLQRVDER